MTDAPPKPRRGRRRLVRALVVAALLAVALRAALPLALPAVVDRIAAGYGLEARWERLELSLLSGQVELWHLVVRERAAEGEPPREPILHLEYADVNAATTALLAGRLHVERVEVDGLDAVLERGADGRLALARLFAPDPDAPPREREPERGPPSDGGEPAGPIALDLPVRIDALRAQHVEVRVVDASVEPVFDEVFEITARVSDVGSAERRTRLSVIATCPGVLDALEIDGSGSSGGRTLGSHLDVHLSGLHPRRLASQLERLGVVPHAEEIHARLSLEARIEPAADDENAGRGTLELGELALVSDLRTAFGIESIRLDVPRLARDAVELGDLDVRGVTGAAGRRANGNLVVAGLELIPRAGADPTREDDPPAEERPGAALPELRLREVRVTDVSLAFRDEAVAPPTETELAVETLTVGPVAFGADAEARPPVAIDARLAAPEIAERVRVTGRLVGPARHNELELRVDVDGIAPERARPYLEAAGLESTFDDGALTLEVAGWLDLEDDGVLRAGLEVRDVVLSDGAPLFELRTAAVRDVAYDPAGPRLAVAEVEVAGLAVDAARDEDGVLRALGLAVPGGPRVARGPGAPGAPSPAPPAVRADARGARPVPAAAPAARGAPLRVEVGRLAWTGSRVGITDRALPQPLDLALDDFGVEVSGLALGGPAPGSDPPAEARVWFRADGVADEVALEGTIASGPGPLDLDVDAVLRGRGIAPRAFDPWLAEAGVESLLASASLDGRLAARVRTADGALRADATVSALSFTDGGVALAAVDELSVRELVAGPGAIEVGAVRVVGPRIAAARDADGGLRALGLRVPPPEPSAEDGDAPAADAPAAPPEAGADAAPAPPATRLALGELEVVDAEVAWSDAFPEAPVELAASARARVEGLVFADGAPPARVSVGARLDGALDELALDGTATLSPTALGADLALDLRGVRAGPLAAYLPETVDLAVADGRLHADVSVALGPGAEGGRAAHAEVTGVAWRDGPEGEPLFAFERLVARAPRLDPEGGHYEVAEVALEGLTLDARLVDERTVTVAGLALRAPEPDAGSAEPAAAGAAEPTAPAAPPTGRRTYPTVTLGRLDVDLARLTFLDELGEGAEPVEGHLRFGTTGPAALLSPDPEALPPVEVFVEGALAPLVENVEIAVSADPWSPDPAIEAWWLVSGLRGAELTRVAPELAATLDAERLEDARLEGRLEGALRWRRRGPTDFDLSNGFGLELDVDDLALRPTPYADPLLGLDALHVDVANVAPTGDVHVKSIEIVKPTGRVRLLEEGLEVFGVLVRARAPEPAAEGAEGPGPPNAADAAAAPDASAPPPPELRIDSFLVDEIDFLFEDRSVDPPMILPLADLHVQLRRFTTRAFTERRPVRFRAYVGAGPVEMPVRDPSHFLSGQTVKNLTGSVTGTATSVLTLGRGGGKKKDPDKGAAPKTEMRPLFDEIAVSGNLVLHPEPEGWVKAQVAALELASVRGRAADAGVSVRDGVLDTTVNARLRGSQGIDVRSRTTFAWLDVSEPENGLLSRTLNLSVPVDTAIFLLRDANAEIHLPVDFTVKDEGLEGVGAAATSAIASVLASAIAGSPLRVANTATDVVTLGGSLTSWLPWKRKKGDEPVAEVEVRYAAGVPVPERAELERLRPLLERMRREKDLALIFEHRIGSADLERAAALSSPEPEDTLALAERLRGKRAEARARRERLAAEVRVLYATGRDEAAEDAAHRLRTVEGEIGETEEALDSIYDLLRAGAERRQRSRTRAAAIAMAEKRLLALKREVVALGEPTWSERIEVRTPRVRAAETEGGGTVLVTAKRRR